MDYMGFYYIIIMVGNDCVVLCNLNVVRAPHLG